MPASCTAASSVPGMAGADPEFDEAGTWVASSYVRATARDYARFGLLYMRDGTWDGVRLLPAGWVDYGRTMVSVDDPEDPSPHGAHWWGVRGDTLENLDPLGTFRASGYEGQTITICPALDLVVVRLGKTPLDREDALVPWRARGRAGLRRPPAEKQRRLSPGGGWRRTPGSGAPVFSWYSA